MSEELKRHKEALEVAIGGLRELGLDYAHHTARVEAKINAILHPEPEYEEIEIVRWYCLDCGVSENEKFDVCVCSSTAVIKLTGTLRRQKVKVERSVTVKAAFFLDETNVNFRQKVLTPWIDEIPTGKDVTLTVTWTE